MNTPIETPQHPTPAEELSNFVNLVSHMRSVQKEFNKLPDNSSFVLIAGYSKRVDDLQVAVDLKIKELTAPKREQPAPEEAYFKSPESDGIYTYYKVVGGPGKTKAGFLIRVNLLNPAPIISREVNQPGSLTGTWCLYEVGIPIAAEEFYEQLTMAVKCPGSVCYGLVDKQGFPIDKNGRIK